MRILVLIIRVAIDLCADNASIAFPFSLLPFFFSLPFLCWRLVQRARLSLHSRNINASTTWCIHLYLTILAPSIIPTFLPVRICAEHWFIYFCFFSSEREVRERWMILNKRLMLMISSIKSKIFPQLFKKNFKNCPK